MGREKKLLLNVGSGLLYHVLSVVSGLILPRLIIEIYGSNVNGLMHSLSQFLSIITLLEMGMSSVISANLYKPLVNKDYNRISQIYKSSQRFFMKIGFVFAFYLLCIAIVYPLSVKGFDFLYILSMAAILSMSTFAQYFLGISNLIVLNADQMQYFVNGIKCVSLVISTLLSIVLLKSGVGIHVVQLMAGLVYLVQPVALKIYVNQHYHINHNVLLDSEPIKQKWNGIAQHIAFYVTMCTDTIVLTLFSTLTNVSVYSVYALVLNGVTGILDSLTSSISPYFGNLIAAENRETLNKQFGFIEWAVHQGVTFVYSATLILIIPFIQIYTTNVRDTNYILPLFSVLITVAYAFRTLRIPYNSIVYASGYFRQTQVSSIIEAAINIVVSVIGVKISGVAGVAVGTLLAMMYRTLYLVIYLSKNILKRSIKYYIKNIFSDFIVCVGSLAVSFLIDYRGMDYQSWIIYAVEVSLIILIISVCVNLIMYKLYVLELKNCFKKRR